MRRGVLPESWCCLNKPLTGRSTDKQSSGSSLNIQQLELMRWLFCCYWIGMARPLRVERPAAWYHVTGRGLERRPIFRDDLDRNRWMALVAEAVPMFGWVVHGYTLMDNHYHL